MRLRSAVLLAPLALALGAALPPATAALPNTSQATATSGVLTKSEVAPTTIKPATLRRGQDPAIPRVLGTTILDGSLRIKVPAEEVQLLGTSGRDYVVATWSDNGRAKVERVTVDGDREPILDRINGDLVLSSDGQQLFETVVRTESHTVVTVRDAHSGDRLARRTFRGFVSVLDADEDRAVLGAWSPNRTFWWHTRTNGTKNIAGMVGYFADIRANRVATLTADAYAGGCSLLLPLSTPSKTLWRSCRQAVLASSPNGRRMLTQYILADGPMGTAEVHGDHGRLIATYRTPGWFGPAAWESNRSLLMLTHGARKTAVVRCKSSACERASKLIDIP